MGVVQSRYALAEDGCPVDHRNMSKEEIAETMARFNRSGHPEVSPQAQHNFDTQSSTSTSDNARLAEQEQSHTSSSCPVDHKNMNQEQIAAYMAKHKHLNSTDKKPKQKTASVYDVYGQELDRANLMPTTPNQLPSPGQAKPLSTDREKSSIPKSGEVEAETWAYPSEQMFYNALKRKGKADGVEESDMATVVAVHNTMNERTWKEVLDWERMYHCHKCEHPKLKSFMGRPNDLSPAARYRTWFRDYPMPFDRHDWIIDRCGEEVARYIIDYYYRDGPDPIEIHVRPALDSFPAAADRLRRGAESLRERLLGDATESAREAQKVAEQEMLLRSARQIVSGDHLDKEEFDFLSNLTPKGIQEIADDVQERCAKLSDAFREAGDDPEKLERANMSVNYCMAQRICKTQAADFMTALETGKHEAEAYVNMTSCLDRFHIMARRAMLEASGVIQSGPEFPAGVTPSVSPTNNSAPASGE